jgi:hypothetical protein
MNVSKRSYPSTQKTETLWDLPAARVVLPEGPTEDGDGLLPLSLFARVSFRHHEGYMVVQPR